LGVSRKPKTGRGRFIVRAFVDMVGIFGPITGAPKQTWTGTVKSKRILILNWRDQRHTYAGGAEVYIHELAKRLAADGNLITFFCGSDGQGAPRHETIDGVHIVRRGGFYFVYIWAFFYYMLRFRKRYDLIIDCHNGIPFFTPLFAREPVICIVHHVHQEVFKRHMSKPMAAIACFLEAKMMPRIYNRSQFVAVSPSTRSEMQKTLNIQANIKLIYNGIDLDMLKPGTKSKSPSVLFLGRLQSYKSVDVAIKAFKKVHRVLPKAILTIAGQGDATDSLKSLVKAEHMQKYITFTGRVSDDQKLQLLQKSWLMVNPSFMEGWGLTTIEANACATPVIGSNVPGLRDSIKHAKTGILVPYGDHKQFATAMTEVLSNKKLRSQLSSEAHAWAQNFHWDSSADKLRDLISHELQEYEANKAFTHAKA
jgi:glycosyltransferase involved in cell wall biosynthesis